MFTVSRDTFRRFFSFSATRCTLPRSFPTNLSRITHRIIYFSFNKCIYIYGDHFSSQSTITRDNVRLFFPFRAKHFPSFTHTLSLSLTHTFILSRSRSLALAVFALLAHGSCFVTRSLLPFDRQVPIQIAYKRYTYHIGNAKARILLSSSFVVALFNV